MAEARRAGLIGEAIKQAKQVRKITLGYVRDLDAEALAWRPAADANPIGWMLWHIGEVEESVLWTVEGQAPRWEFGRSALAARESGAALPAPAEILAYLEQVRQRYLAWLQALPDDQVDRVVGEGVWKGPASSLMFLAPKHESYHCGQITYVRRLMGRSVPDANEENPYR
jgi:uncharacterized damage-inducible protein DinB